jgi:predicted TPR repeat methyltransferase
LDQYTDAKKIFATVLDMDPYHIETLINMGLCYLQEDHYSEAMHYYERAIAIDSGNVEAHYNLAIIAEHKNNVDIAIQHYLIAEKQQPDNFAIQNNLGIAFMKRDIPDRALKHFEKAAVLQPDNEDIRYKVAALKSDSRQHAAPHAYIQRLFDNYAERFDQHVREGLDYRVPEAMQEVLATLLPEPTPCYDIADLGCGTGLMGDYLKPYAKTLTGIDLSPNMIAKAREKNYYDVLVDTSIEEYLATHKHHYDLLIAADVFVYTGNLHKLFSVCHAALKKEGYFLFSCERTDYEDYTLLPSGRFAHNHDYLTGIAEQCGFIFLSAMDTPTRMQYEKPVMGSLYLFVK